MDKNVIKKYAVWAREELIKRVSARAEKYGISKDNMVAGTAETVNGILLTSSEKEQRSKLIEQIKTKGYEQVMEEVAYTWFNRFCALRFMEVNNYLPIHIRVFTDENNKFEPQIMAEAIHLELDGLNKSKVLDLKEKNANDELYKYLLITQCNALSSILPGMFQKISDYTELLFPDNILREGSVIEQMITLIDEEDWQDAVQIIGWLYQYYNSVPKDMVFANLKKNIKIRKEDIPAATQLFTPDWIVRYMVENSLGRLWYEGHPDDALKSNWKYYLDEAEQEEEVQAQLDKICEEYKLMKPEDIKCIDPCMGSGHILVYMFDVLMQIYESYGYNARDAAASIVEKNLYGLDIDDRAAQLAYFAVMMKARQYDRRFFSRDIKPHIYVIKDSNGITSHALNSMGNDLEEAECISAKEQIMNLVEVMQDAKEYGSVLNIAPCNWDFLREFSITNHKNEQMKLDIYEVEVVSERLQHLINIAEVLSQKYDVYVTNPPYLGNKSMSDNTSAFLKKNYDTLKMDLFAVFIKRGFEMTKPNGQLGFMTPFVWMFISSFSDLRCMIIENGAISSLIQLEYSGFDGATVPICTFTIAKRTSNFTGEFIKLSTFKGVENQEIRTLEAISNKKCEYRYSVESSVFKRFPENAIAYWASYNFISLFEKNKRIDEFFPCKKGMTTGDNNQFLRMWFEIKNEKIGVQYRYYCKGGGYRRWYGNGENLIDWINNGQRLRMFKGATLRNEAFYFKKAITWGLITSSKFSARAISDEYAIGDAGPVCIVTDEKYNYILGLLNSIVATYIMDFLNPTMNFSSGVIGSLPFVDCLNGVYFEKINFLVENNVCNSKTDWDAFEISWDFKTHPLVQNLSIQSAFEAWEQECTTRFTQLKQNEEELNRIFIEIYGLQDELTPEVTDKDVTVRLADKTRDIKSFISYAVGCMFGRYSHYTEGLFYAGGLWDYGSKVDLLTDFARENGLAPWNPSSLFLPDRDNIIPICDDEYFDDDIVGRFVSFVETVYGKETLEENLKFIADALGGKGQSKDVIRNYFLNDFFADHCKIYQKRPIYWLFDSGKKNGFKALIYMHRYQPDMLARMRTDYVHEQQGRYRTAINDLQHRISDASTAERVKLTKQLAKIQDQDTELRIYEEKIHHLADQMIAIDLDDGVKHNYELFQDVLAKIK